MRIITLEDMYIFRCVAREGGVLRAAERLNRVPSNVSTRIKQFETRLGIKLFRREGRHLKLSDAGKNLLAHAERLLRMADEIEQEVCHGAAPGTLRLGALESAASVRLPPLLAKYHTEHPETHIELQTGTTEALLDQLKGFQLDAVFISEPYVPNNNLSSVKAFKEKLVLITPQGFPTIKTSTELHGQSVVAFPHGCSYRRLLVDWFAESRSSPSRFLDLGSYHAIVACVAAGAGLAIVPESVLDHASCGSSIKRHSLPKKIQVNHTHLVWSGEASRSLQNFIKMLPDLKM